MKRKNCLFASALDEITNDNSVYDGSGDLDNNNVPNFEELSNAFYELHDK